MHTLSKATLLLLVGFLAAPGAPSLTLMQRHFVVDAADRDALCNNGSDAAYYYRPGTSDDTWVVFLGGTGGGGCPTVADCDQRWSNLPRTMATSWIGVGGQELEIVEELAYGGILSDDPAENPHLHDANHVYVYPCSNDSWKGTAPAGPDTGGWAFLGDPTVSAVIEDLQTEHPLSLANADELLLVGSNAGADGVRHHLADVADQLPGVLVLGVIDGRMHTDYRPDGWAFFGPDGEVTAVRHADELHGVTPPDGCFVDHGPDADRCYLFHSHYPYVDEPLFVIMSQIDSYNLRTLWGVPDPLEPGSPETRAYRASLLRALRQLPRGTGYFAPAVDWHRNNLLKPHFSDHAFHDPITGLDLSAADALEAWRMGVYVPRLVEPLPSGQGADL